ncbi:MAG: ligase [Intrasporangiaceae bacterium]|nr:ligase [Intrasporangiaceae bacterium]
MTGKPSRAAIPTIVTVPTKQDRRRELRARRRTIAASRDLPADGRRIADHALALIRSVTPGEADEPMGYASRTSPPTITLYEPLPVEPDVSALLHEAYALGIRVIVPITLPDLDLDWAQWSPDGLGEPLGKDAVADVTVAFIPGLSVDDSGTRMGQGGGCYDRTLPRIGSGAPVVCVLHPGEDHTVPALPREAHDVPVDGVLTADGLRWVD